MKSAVIKATILLALITLVLTPVILQFNSGSVDPFYTRLTTERAPSLIIGTSRAAQGLLPQTFKDIAPQMQNFSFTLLHSPFGPAYLELIKDKLDEGVNEGLFIIAVDPWALSSLDKKKEAGLENLRENRTFVPKIHSVNVNPNLEYIFRYYDKPFYHSLKASLTSVSVLHRDGWLEISVPVDSATVQKNIQEKIKDYHKYAANGAIEPIRIRALMETITFLDKHGEVYLVRLPVAKEMASIENEYVPDFDRMMYYLADTHNVQYLNYFDESGEYLTTDGNHLYKQAARALSKKVASDIKRIRHLATVD